MSSSFVVLLASTISIGFIHALAPDHWMPFAMLAKSQKWSRLKLALITFISGLGHVGSSILFGAIGLLLGISLAKLKQIEGHRAEIALWLLIGFGIAYALWGLKKAKGHKHLHIDEDGRSKNVSIWTLFAIFVLGPCEPLIPLVFLANEYGIAGISGVAVAFSAVTIFMMIAQSMLAYKGIQLIPHGIAERYSHVFAGLVIAGTGALVMMLGI